MPLPLQGEPGGRVETSPSLLSSARTSAGVPRHLAKLQPTRAQVSNIRKPPRPTPPATQPDESVCMRLAREARSMGQLVIAGKGAGKSRLLGRRVGFGDFMREVPLVIFDPLGGTIDNFLDKVDRLPSGQQRQAWRRVRYVNMAGEGVGRRTRVIPWPIYARTSSFEDSHTVSQRYLDVLVRADPKLSEAAVYGLNTLGPLVSAAGMVLTALSLGVTEMDSLLIENEYWRPRVAALKELYPELKPAITHLENFWGSRDRDMRRHLVLG